VPIATPAVLRPLPVASLTALASPKFAQRFALDERHDVVEEPAGLAGVEQREDVRVLQLGRDVDLTQEPLWADGGGQLGSQDLDGDLAVVLEVVGQVDGGHAALAQLARDPVVVGERVAQAGLKGRHGPKMRPPRGLG
jgi:hypothetical protein